MNKLFTIAFLASSIFSFGQIALEHVYDMRLGADYLSNETTIYHSLQISNDTLLVYGDDHTLKQTTVVNLKSSGSVQLATDQLFDLDAGIEFLIDLSGEVYVIDDDGSILLHVPNTFILTTYDHVIQDGNEFKLLFLQGANTLVYSLPGSYPIAGVEEDEIERQLRSNVYPNPAIEYTKIAYQLPEGEKEADLVIYAATGKEIQRSRVGALFNDILVNTSTFQEGTYMYHLVTNDTSALQGKFVVIK